MSQGKSLVLFFFFFQNSFSLLLKLANNKIKNAQEMCQDYHKNLDMSFLLLQFYGFHEYFMGFVIHAINISQ